MNLLSLLLSSMKTDDDGVWSILLSERHQMLLGAHTIRLLFHDHLKIFRVDLSNQLIFEVFLDIVSFVSQRKVVLARVK